MTEAKHDDASGAPLSDAGLGRSGVGEWCAPGPVVGQSQKWLLVFDDADRGMLPFDDEHDARSAFARAERGGWNCHLFETARRVPNKQ